MSSNATPQPLLLCPLRYFSSSLFLCLSFCVSFTHTHTPLFACLQGFSSIAVSFLCLTQADIKKELGIAWDFRSQNTFQQIMYTYSIGAMLCCYFFVDCLVSRSVFSFSFFPPCPVFVVIVNFHVSSSFELCASGFLSFNGMWSIVWLKELCPQDLYCVLGKR